MIERPDGFLNPTVGQLVFRSEDTSTSVTRQEDPVNLYRACLVVCSLVACNPMHGYETFYFEVTPKLTPFGLYINLVDLIGAISLRTLAKGGQNDFGAFSGYYI